MPTARKVFTVARPADADTGLPFDIVWVSAEGLDAGEQQGSEEFKAFPKRIPGAVLIDALAVLDGDGMHVEPVWEVFRCALGDDYERFAKIIRDPNKTVPAELIAEIVAWFMEETTGRPTEPSLPSPGQRRTIGA